MGKGINFRKKPFKIILIVAFFIGLFSVQLNTSQALPFNLLNEGITLRGYQDIDRTTEISKQYSTFRITKIQDIQEHITSDFSNEIYENNEIPEEWGCEEIIENNEIIYYSKTLKSNIPVILPQISNREYSPNSKNSNVSFRLAHLALGAESMHDNQGPRLEKIIDQSTIGEISFDVMPLMAVDIEGNENYKSYGELHFKIDDVSQTTPGFHLMFRTEPSLTGGQFVTSVYVYEINPENGNKDILTKIFETIPNNLNWMNVRLFYDLYNDVYNVTVGQYYEDFRDNWLKTPISTIFRGLQYDVETYEISNDQSLIGDYITDISYGRYTASHLIDTINFWVQTDENTPVGKSSEAYIDNVKQISWHFPAVYADVTLFNKEIGRRNPAGISVLNNSIITCYEPPKYPSENAPIFINGDYLLNPKNPNVLTTWLYAPSWVYALPIVASTDHELNIKSILFHLNNVEKPIEERGLFNPRRDSPYYTNPERRIASQYFEFNETGSDEYLYRFDARHGSQFFLIEYQSDLQREGMLKSVQLFNSSEIEDFLLYDFSFQYFGTFYGDEAAINGFPIGIISLIAGVLIIHIYLKNKKHLSQR